MTARSLRVKKSTLARIRSSSSGTRPRPNFPKSPPIGCGPKSYGATKSGQAVVVARFYVTRHVGNTFREWKKKQENWFVMDFKENRVARGTKTHGYGSKKAAIRAAEEVRDEFGAYARSPF